VSGKRIHESGLALDVKVILIQLYISLVILHIKYTRCRQNDFKVYA
jgi:hypothetical protein